MKAFNRQVLAFVAAKTRRVETVICHHFSRLALGCFMPQHEPTVDALFELVTSGHLEWFLPAALDGDAPRLVRRGGRTVRRDRGSEPLRYRVTDKGRKYLATRERVASAIEVAP